MAVKVTVTFGDFVVQFAHETGQARTDVLQQEQFVEAHLTLFGRRRSDISNDTIETPYYLRLKAVEDSPQPLLPTNGTPVDPPLIQPRNTGRPVSLSLAGALELGGSSSEREGSSVDLSPPPLLPAKDIGSSVDVPEATESSVDPEGKSIQGRKEKDQTFFSDLLELPGATQERQDLESAIDSEARSEGKSTFQKKSFS